MKSAHTEDAEGVLVGGLLGPVESAVTDGSCRAATWGKAFQYTRRTRGGAMGEHVAEGKAYTKNVDEKGTERVHTFALKSRCATVRAPSCFKI